MCTTVNYPTQHRPAVNNRSEEEKMRYVVKQENRGIAADDSISDISEPCKVTSRWHAANWDLAIPGKVPVMHQITTDYESIDMPFDSLLEDIISFLDSKY